MTRSPRTAVFTSSKEAEYASMSLSSSSGGGERERAITFGEKICVSLWDPGSQSQRPTDLVPPPAGPFSSPPQKERCTLCM